MMPSTAMTISMPNLRTAFISTPHFCTAKYPSNRARLSWQERFNRPLSGLRHYPHRSDYSTKWTIEIESVQYHRMPFIDSVDRPEKHLFLMFTGCAVVEICNQLV
jgi:hypothetical protein